MFKFLSKVFEPLCFSAVRFSNRYGFIDGDDDDGSGVGVDDDGDDDDADDDAGSDDDIDAPGIDDNNGDGDDDGGMDIDLAPAGGDAKKKKATNKKFAEMRKNNSTLKKQLDDQNNRIAELMARPAPAPVARPVANPNAATFNGVPIPKTDSEWDELAKTNWKLAVDMRSSINAKHVVSQRTEVDQATTTLQKSKALVLERHPELDEAFSEKSKVYKRILDSNPHYITDPRGPVHAMRDMEEYMEFDMGIDRAEILKAIKKSKGKKDSNKENRTKLLNTQGRNNTSTKNVVRLDKEDLDFCKFNGIDPKEFAKNKISLAKAGKGGLQ